MAFSRVALGALVAMLASQAQAEGVKWVPLKPPEPIKPKEKAASAVTSRPIPSIAQTPSEPAPMATATVQGRTASTGRLDLTCFGAGTANKVAATTAFSNAYASGLAGTSTWSGHGSGTTTVYGTRQQAFGDQVDVRLFGGDDRIRMPRTMLPLIRGGKEGWFKLKNVVADARSIRAKAAVNLANNPNVFIDRVTGTISISGKAGDYAGQCQAIDASAPAKF